MPCFTLHIKRALTINSSYLNNGNGASPAAECFLRADQYQYRQLLSIFFYCWCSQVVCDNKPQTERINKPPNNNSLLQNIFCPVHWMRRNFCGRWTKFLGWERCLWQRGIRSAEAQFFLFLYSSIPNAVLQQKQRSACHKASYSLLENFLWTTFSIGI